MCLSRGVREDRLCLGPQARAGRRVGCRPQVDLEEWPEPGVDDMKSCAQAVGLVCCPADGTVALLGAIIADHYEPLQRRHCGALPASVLRPLAGAIAPRVGTAGPPGHR